MLIKNKLLLFENCVYLHVDSYFDKVIHAKCTFINIVICFVQKYMMKQCK